MEKDMTITKKDFVIEVAKNKSGPKQYTTTITFLNCCVISIVSEKTDYTKKHHYLKLPN